MLDLIMFVVIFLILKLLELVTWILGIPTAKCEVVPEDSPIWDKYKDL